MTDSLFDMSFGYNLPQSSGQGGLSSLPTPDLADVFFQKSFNSMLSDLTSAVVSEDGESGDSESDPFGSMFDVGLSGLSGANGVGGMEQLMSLNSGSALIGKEVEYIDHNESQKGTVDKVVVESGVPYLVIGDSKVSVSDVLSIMGGS